MGFPSDLVAWRGAAGPPAAVDLRFGAGRRGWRLGPILVHQRLATRGRHVRLHLPGKDLGVGRALLKSGSSSVFVSQKIREVMTENVRFSSNYHDVLINMRG